MQLEIGDRPRFYPIPLNRPTTYQKTVVCPLFFQHPIPSEIRGFNNVGWAATPSGL